MLHSCPVLHFSSLHFRYTGLGAVSHRAAYFSQSKFTSSQAWPPCLLHTIILDMALSIRGVGLACVGGGCRVYIIK